MRIFFCYLEFIETFKSMNYEYYCGSFLHYSAGSLIGCMVQLPSGMESWLLLVINISGWWWTTWWWGAGVDRARFWVVWGVCKGVQGCSFLLSSFHPEWIQSRRTCYALPQMGFRLTLKSSVRVQWRMQSFQFWKLQMLSTLSSGDTL